MVRRTRIGGPDELGAIALTIPAFSIFTAIAMMVGIEWRGSYVYRSQRENTTSGQTLFSQSCSSTAVPTQHHFKISIALYFLDDMIALMKRALLVMAGLTHDYLSVMPRNILCCTR
ncbi:hypothetical protein O9992_21905 [Vibrio lentus]|nr:hypothetical protein [Vibrio lentus]